MAKVVTLGRRYWPEEIASHGNRWRHLGEQRQQELEGTIRGNTVGKEARKAAQKNYWGGAYREYGYAR